MAPSQPNATGRGQGPVRISQRAKGRSAEKRPVLTDESVIAPAHWETARRLSGKNERALLAMFRRK